jgi:hypothetical protein
MNLLKQFIANIKAKITKHYVTKQVVSVLKLTHAQELANTPGEMWPQVRAKHTKQIEAVHDGKLDIVDRRSWAFPFLPSTLTRLQQPIIKMIPYNLRRFARTPIPRRAINMIKNSVTSLDWDIIPLLSPLEAVDEDQETRIQIGKACFNHPNNEQSWQSFLDTGIDDFCIMGAMVIEPQLTPDPKRPIKMWNVDASTIRFFPNWRESDPTQPKYAQMTGLRGERGVIIFYDDELVYIKDNPSVETPFGTSKMEIAFQSILSFLGVQEMSGRAGADQVHRSWLWWENNVGVQNLDILRRHITNDLEGQAKINLMSGFKAPEVISVTTVTEEDLLLNWQELLIRMIAAGFDMSAQAFLERDVNRSTGEVLSDMDFRSAVVPTAVRIAEYFTRFILHRKLGWYDLEFKFLNLDDPDFITKIDILQKQYACNAITPNEIRQALGKPKLATPFAELTQFEMILLNTEAQGKVQDANAEKSAQRQQQLFQQQMEQQMQYSQSQQEQDGQRNTDQQASAKNIKLKVPKQKPWPKNNLKPLPKMPALKLPLLPMAGSRYNCYEVADMSLSQLMAAMDNGTVPSDPDDLVQQMTTQDPDILEQLSPEVQTYLDALLKKQQDEDAKKKPKVTPKAKKDQLKKFRKGQHVPAEVEHTVYRTALQPGKSTKETQAIAPAFIDKRTTGITPGAGRGKEVSITDVRTFKKRRE